MKTTVFISILLVGLCMFSLSIAETFNGYPCTVDCSGHGAGYEWAEEKGIKAEDDCSGNSNSFIEGCRSYVEEQEGYSQNNNWVNEEETDDYSESDLPNE